jgi:site-specific DNA-methyltransferase (adenine-specific)
MTLQLLHGDCLELMATLPDKSIDCFICDLPYGCLTSARKGKRVGPLTDPSNPNSNIQIVNEPCAWDVQIDLPKLWEQIKRLARNDHVPVLMFCTARFGYDLIKSNESWFRYDLIWEKTNGVGFLSANKQPLRRHELVYVFAKKGAAYKRVDEEGDFPSGGGGRSSGSVYNTQGMPNLQNTVAGKRCSTSVVCMANKKARGAHPTAKPVDLYKWLLERYCPAGGTALDPTFGSCNSGRAAHALGLKYIGIERDAGFFTTAQQNLQPSDGSVIQHLEAEVSE